MCVYIYGRYLGGCVLIHSRKQRFRAGYFSVCAACAGEGLQHREHINRRRRSTMPGVPGKACSMEFVLLLMCSRVIDVFSNYPEKAISIECVLLLPVAAQNVFSYYQLQHRMCSLITSCSIECVLLLPVAAQNVFSYYQLVCVCLQTHTHTYIHT